MTKIRRNPSEKRKVLVGKKKWLQFGDVVIIKTPSCSTNINCEAKELVGKFATVIWVNDFRKPQMQGIAVVVNDKRLFMTGWSWFTGKEFEKVP